MKRNKNNIPNNKEINDYIDRWIGIWKEFFNGLEKINPCEMKWENNGGLLDQLIKVLDFICQSLRESYYLDLKIDDDRIQIKSQPICRSESELCDMLIQEALLMTCLLSIKVGKRAKDIVLPSSEKSQLYPSIVATACLYSFPGFLMYLIDLPNEKIKIHSLASVSGWISSKIILKKNKRLVTLLNKSIRSEGYTTLRNLLPPAVIESIGDLHWSDAVKLLIAEYLKILLSKVNGKPVGKDEKEYKTLLNMIISTLGGFLIKEEGYRLKNGHLIKGQIPESDLVGAEDSLKGGLEYHALRDEAFHDIERLLNRDELDSMIFKAGLSPQESKIIELLRQGNENPQIAEKLGIEPSAVRVGKHNAISKLRKASGLGQH